MDLHAELAKLDIGKQNNHSLIDDIHLHKLKKAIEIAKHYQYSCKKFEEMASKRSRQVTALMEEVSRLRIQNALLQSRLPAPVQVVSRHKLEFYRDMMQKVCQDMADNLLEPGYLEVVARFFQISSLGATQSELCQIIKKKQKDHQILSQCQNRTDAFSQEDIASIPYPFFISFNGFCFNILDLATDSNVSRQNPYTRESFPPAFINQIQQRLNDLQLIADNHNQ